MKHRYFGLIAVLVVTALAGCTKDKGGCEVADWVGQYTRTDGGNCDNWEQKTDPTMSITQSPFATDEVIINSLPGMKVTGCVLQYDYAGTTTTWTLRDGKVTTKSSLTGCQAVYEK